MKKLFTNAMLHAVGSFHLADVSPKYYQPKYLGRVKPKGSPAAQQRAAKKRKALRARSAKK